ncbi:MAG: hypothetical protein LH619_04390 [Chitinophagaceae bacterium]|nr:hypothetical protein [Chitinophagaceae bacterium]
MRQHLSILFLLFVFTSCSSNKELKLSAGRCISEYNTKYTSLSTKGSEEQWKANTEIRPGDSTNDVLSQKAQEAFAAFTGKKDIVDSARYFLDNKKAFTDLQVRQLNMILYQAGNNPEIAKDLVKQRIKQLLPIKNS